MIRGFRPALGVSEHGSCRGSGTTVWSYCKEQQERHHQKAPGTDELRSGRKDTHGEASEVITNNLLLRDPHGKLYTGVCFIIM